MPPKKKAAAEIETPRQAKAQIKKNKTIDPAENLQNPVLVETPKRSNSSNSNEKVQEINDHGTESSANESTESSTESSTDKTASQSAYETQRENTQSQVGLTWVGEPSPEILSMGGQIVSHIKVGEIMTPFAQRFTVALRYTGNTPEDAVKGNFPSKAKYKINRNNVLIAYGIDALELLRNPDFSEA